MRMVREAAVLLSAAFLAVVPGPASQPPSRLLPMTLSGTVADEGGRPIPGAFVRAYRAALPAGSTVTDEEGNYFLDFAVDPDKDETVLIWWISPRTDLVSEVAIVRESSRDRELGLWGVCVPRIGAIREQTRSVRLLDAAGLRQKIKQEGCAH